MKRRARAPLPLATGAVAAAIVAVHGLELAAGGLPVCERWGFTASHPSVTTALASMWLHDPEHVGHVVGNVLLLAVVGAVVEPVLGRWRLLALFVASGLGGAAVHLLVAAGSDRPLVGASGAIMGLAAVGAVVRPRAMLGGVVAYAALNVLGLFVETTLMPAGVSVSDHIGGFAAGAALVVLTWLRGVDLGRRARSGNLAPTVEFQST